VSRVVLDHGAVAEDGTAHSRDTKSMFHFHVNLLARSTPHTTFPRSFEETQSRLQQLPRMDTEPDGFFLVAGECDSQRWVVNGQLFESGDRLHRVELHGNCPEATFDDLLRCFGWPEVELSFELVRKGLTLDEASFRHHARQPP
jgi:hypothetical protein